MANTIKSKLISKGFMGERLDDFCNMLGVGSVNTLVGLPFQTFDTGLTPGTGTGIGTGILGVVPSVVKTNILSQLSSYTGERLDDVISAIAEALVAELANATLTSQHSPVHTGTGVVVLGSIQPQGSVWGNNIYQQGLNQGFVGSELSGFCMGIGVGCAMSFTTATGNVTITGSGGNTPGSGTGTGTIS